MIKKAYLFFFLAICPSKVWALGTNYVLTYAKPGASLNEYRLDDGSAGYKNGSFGFGVLFHQYVFISTDIEFGIFYAQRGFTLNSSVATFTESFDSVHLPVLIKFYFLPFVFVGAGGYFSHALSQTSPLLYSANDRGWIVSLGVKPEISSQTYLLADFRYLLGSTNVSQVPGTTIYLRDLQFIFGLSIGY